MFVRMCGKSANLWWLDAFRAAHVCTRTTKMGDPGVGHVLGKLIIYYYRHLLDPKI